MGDLARGPGEVEGEGRLEGYFLFNFFVVRDCAGAAYYGRSLVGGWCEGGREGEGEGEGYGRIPRAFLGDWPRC